MPGTLFLLTGLPFSGQKTLTRALRAKLGDSPTTAVLLPAVSNAEHAEEKDDTIVLSDDAFKQEGDFLTSWKAECLMGYLMQHVTDAFQTASKVVLRVPREKLGAVEASAQSLGGVEVKIINLQVAQDVLVARAAAVEGHDGKFNDKAFLKKIKAVPDAKGTNLSNLDNDGDELAGFTALLQAIGFDPLVDLPPQLDENGQLTLASCPPQDYLRRTLYPFLLPAMERVNVERPADPIEFIAMYLKQAASTQKKRETELTQLKNLKTKLRADMASELKVVGRV